MENSNIETTQTFTPSGDQLRPLRQVALIFFIIVGSAHILSGLFISQNLLMPVSNIINKVLDIPFALIAVIYGLSNLHLSPDSPRRKLYYALMIIIALLVLGIMLYINLLVPDRIS